MPESLSFGSLVSKQKNRPSRRQRRQSNIHHYEVFDLPPVGVIADRYFYRYHHLAVMAASLDKGEEIVYANSDNGWGGCERQSGREKLD